MREFHDVDELIEHLRGLGATASAETAAFTELDHGLQCAAILERDHADDVELQVAGLVHDLAHPWDGPGQPRHASMGADAVRPILGERVAGLVGGHVAAKRYLVTVDSGYRSTLSKDSIATLAAQGGDLDAAGVEAFRMQGGWEAMVALRRADDGAKVAGAEVPGLDHWVDAIRAVARRHGEG